MSNFQNLVSRLANLNPEQVKLRSLGNNRVLITLSSETAANIFSIEASEVNGKLVVGNYLLKRDFGQTSISAIENAVVSMVDTLNYHGNQPRGTIGHYLDQAYRSIVQAGTYVSTNDANWTSTGALEAMDTARPPIIPGSDVAAMHRTDPNKIPKNILWIPETSPGAGQSTRTIEQYATLAGVHIEAGTNTVITPFPKAKASKTTSSNRPLAPHPDVITTNPLARSVIEQPGVANIAEPMGRAAIHPSWTASMPVGAAYIPIEHDQDRYGSVGVKSQKIDINRLSEVQFQVTSGAIQRGQVLATYGNDKIVSDQNASVFNTRIVVPDTNETWTEVARIKNAGGEIDSRTGLPKGWEFGGTGKSAKIVFDVERWRTIGLSGGVSYKNWGYKSFAFIRDTREISTPINPVTGQPMEDYSQPNLEMGFESQKGSSGVQSLGLLLGSQYRQRALEEIRIHKPFLYDAVNKPTLSLAADENKLVEAAEFLFYKRDWTKDLPFGGVTRFYDPVLGTATLSKDESHGMIPAKALSYISKEQEVGFGRKAVEQAIAIGLASPDTTVKVYREGKLIMSGDEILKREKDLKFGDVFRLEGTGRSIEMAIPLLPRGEYQGRTPRFSGDEMALQAVEMPETVKYMINATKHNTAIYRDVINLARGGIPQSREKEVISLDRTQRSRIGQRYEILVQKFSSAAGLEQLDPWSVPEKIKRLAVKAALQEEFPTINPRELGTKFLKLDEYTVLEPIDEIYQLSHPDLMDREKTKIVRSWFSTFEGVLQNPSREGKDRSYVAHEALRKTFANDEGVQKAASSYRMNAHHIIGRGTSGERTEVVHAWEGPYQIAEEIPAGHIMVGTEVMKHIYKLAYGKLDRNEFHAWEKEIFENSAGIIERRPGVSFEQAGQSTRIIPQRFARSIGLNPASWDKSGVFVSGGTSMASRQNADSDADRLILALFPDINKLPEKARQEIKDTLIKTMTGHYIEEMASSRYPKEYQPGMSPERAALLGGKETQIEAGKEVRDIEEWGRAGAKPGWVKDTHADYTRYDGSQFRDDPDPNTKIFLPHRMTYDQLEATFRRQVQFKNVDVGFAWVYSPTGRFTSENLTKNKKLARQIQTAGAMNYQEALDVGTIVGRRIMDMAKTMTLKGTFRPSDQENPVELNAQSSGGLLPKASSTVGLIPNLAYAAVEEYKNGTLTAERTALKFIPLNDNARLSRLAVELKRSETDALAANINIKNLLGELQDEGLYTNTIAGQLILHQRAQKWLESDDFKYQTPEFQAEIRRAAKVMSAIEGQSGSKPLNEDNLQALIDSNTSYGVVAGEMIGEFIPIPITKQVGRLKNKTDAQLQSQAAHQQYWTQFEQIMNKTKHTSPEKTWRDIAIAAKKGNEAGMNARSPSQLGQGPIDIFERNLVSDENRTYFHPDYVRNAMVRGNIAEEILTPYFKSKGYDTQRHTFDISEDTRSPMIRAGFSGLLDLFKPEDGEYGAEIYDIKTTSQKEYVAQRDKALRFSTAQEIAAGKSHILAPAHRWPQLLSYLTGQSDATAGIKYLPKEAWEEVNGGQLETALKAVSLRHPVAKQGNGAKKAMEADLRGMIADGTIDIEAISAELVKRMVTARVPENSIILKYALDYYNQVNGVMMNLQERGEIPRQLEDTDPEWIKAYKDAKPKSTSEIEARGRAYKNAAEVYAKRFKTELDLLEIPTGDKYDSPFLVGTPLENDHKVIIELPDVDKSVIDKTHGTIEQMLRDQKLKNPMVVRTTGSNTTVLEFSVPSSAQQSKDRSLSNFNWEGWLASDVAPMVKALSPYSSFSMHSPPDQNNPDPLSTVRSLRDRYEDVINYGARYPGLYPSWMAKDSNRDYASIVALDYNKVKYDILGLNRPEKWDAEESSKIQPFDKYYKLGLENAINEERGFSDRYYDAMAYSVGLDTMALHASILKGSGVEPMLAHGNTSFEEFIADPEKHLARDTSGVLTKMFSASNVKNGHLDYSNNYDSEGREYLWGTQVSTAEDNEKSRRAALEEYNKAPSIQLANEIYPMEEPGLWDIDKRTPMQAAAPLPEFISLKSSYTENQDTAESLRFNDNQELNAMEEAASDLWPDLPPPPPPPYFTTKPKSRWKRIVEAIKSPQKPTQEPSNDDPGSWKPQLERPWFFPIEEVESSQTATEGDFSVSPALEDRAESRRAVSEEHGNAINAQSGVSGVNDDQTGSVRKKKGAAGPVVNSGSGQSNLPPPPDTSATPPSGNQQSGNQSGLVTNSDWWTPASRPYEMFGQNTGYREAVEIASGLSNKIDGQNAGALRATDIASQYQRLSASMYGPQNLEASRAVSMQATKLQSELEETHKLYRAANANQDSPVLSAEHLRLGDIAKDADQVAQAFLNLREQTIKTSQDLDQNVGQKLKDSVSSFADTVQQRGLNKKELQDLVEARDKLMPAAQAGSGLSKELIESIDRTIMTQTAKARMGEAGYEEPDVTPRRTRLQKAKEAGSAAEDMAFGNTAFRIRMGLSLTTGNQKQWMNEFMQQQQLVAQAGLMMGAGPSGSGMSTYVQAMNRTANRTAELGEGAAQVLVPMQSFLAGVGGKAGWGSALTMIGNAAGAGMVATYASPAIGKVIQHIPRTGDIGERMQKSPGTLGGIAAITAFVGLGAGYVSGEADNWEKEEPNTWSAAWRYKFSEDRDTYRKYSTATKETFPGSGIPAQSLVYKGFNLPIVGEIAKALDPIGVGRPKVREKEWMAYQRQAWLDSGEGKTWAAEQQVAKLYPGVKTGEATYTLSYLARQTGEPVNNLVTGKYSPGFKELADTQMNFTAAGLTTQQINQVQESVMASQGVMVGTQEAKNLLLSVGRMGAQNNEVAQILYGSLAGTAQRQGYAATNAQRNALQDKIAQWNNSISQGTLRYEMENEGAGPTVDMYQSTKGVRMAIGRSQSAALYSGQQLSEFASFQSGIAPNLLAAGADPIKTSNQILDMFKQGMQNQTYQAENMSVIAKQVSIETGQNANDVMSNLKAMFANGVAQGALGSAEMKSLGQANLSPYGMIYGGIQAQAFEQQVSRNPVTDKFQDTAASILRGGGRGAQYSNLDLEKTTLEVMTFGKELTDAFHQLAQGISPITRNMGLPSGSRQSIMVNQSAALASGQLGTANAIDLSDILSYTGPGFGSVPVSPSGTKNPAYDKYFGVINDTVMNIGQGRTTPNQGANRIQFAGLETPLNIAQYFSGTMSQFDSAITPNGIPGMQTVDEFNLPYGQYTPWTNIAAMSAGEGRGLDSLIAQYQTRAYVSGGTNNWNAMQAKYQEAPMYQQQAQLQIAQIGAQIASSQIEYNATYGGGGYVGSANFARKLQWGEGPSVTPSEVYAERQRQQTEYKLANIGVENPKPFEFNPQMGSSTVSIAQQENAIRREMAQTQMQWRKEDIGFAMQGLEIQRQQLALARQQLALSRQESEITRAYKLEERDTQRGVALMQRSWTQSDWSKNRGRFAVETQWQEEDFSRNIRFTTGREYIQARREQERTRTRRGWQQEDTNTGEDRQKQLWKVEDDRYQKSIEYENQLWEIQQQKFALQEQGLNLQQQSIDLQAAQQAAQLARLEQQQKWQDEEWKLEDKRWELERAQFDEQLKKGQEIYNVRMGVLGKELELAQTQAQHEAGIVAGLTLQNEIAGKLGDANVIGGAMAIVGMINAIAAQYGKLGPVDDGSKHAAGGTVTLPTKLVRGGRVVGLMAERGPEAIVPLSSMMPRSNGSAGTTIVQFILDGEVIMEKVVTPDRLSPIVNEVNERARWR